MIRPLSILCLLGALSFGSPGRSQILIDDKGEGVSQSYSKQATDGFDFRRQRKMGFGVSTAGALGLLGINLELAFSPEASLIGGFGTGDIYQSFSFQYKYVLGGHWLSPYVGMGYAKWYTTKANPVAIETTMPNFLATKFLNDEELRTGVFSENLIFPMAGFQYHQLRGPYSGIALYAHALMLFDLDDFVSAPTGELGAYYYF